MFQKIKNLAPLLLCFGLLLSSSVVCAQAPRTDAAPATAPPKQTDSLPADLQKWVAVINSLLERSTNPSVRFTIVPALDMVRDSLVSKWLCVKFGNDRSINVANLKGEKPDDARNAPVGPDAMSKKDYRDFDLEALKNGIGRSSNDVLLFTPQDYVVATFDDPDDAELLYDKLQALRTYLLTHYNR